MHNYHFVKPNLSYDKTLNIRGNMNIAFNTWQENVVVSHSESSNEKTLKECKRMQKNAKERKVYKRMQKPGDECTKTAKRQENPDMRFFRHLTLGFCGLLQISHSFAFFWKT